MVQFPLLLALTVVVAISFAIPLLRPLQSGKSLCALSLTAAAAYYGRAFAGYFLVISFSYIALRLIAKDTDCGRRWRWACVALLLVGAIFTMGRLQHWNRPIPFTDSASFIIYTLDMWMALRLITVFWEVGSGTVPVPTISTYLVWVCLPFTLAGPLLRMSEMPAQISVNRALWRTGAWWTEAFAAGAKLFVGLALGPLHHAAASAWSLGHAWNSAIDGLIVGPFGFYLSTAGYFHLMEVLARPAGFNLPPSFNFPIGRENLSSFWMNWNMTATFVFRDYLFFNRWGRRNYNAFFNTIVLFTLVGLWHEANAYWILWGFMHGVLFCVFLIWRKYNSRLKGIPLRGTAVSRVCAAALTYVCVCGCWYVPSKVIVALKHRSEVTSSVTRGVSMTTSPENIKESKIVSAVTRALRISSETPGPLRMGSTPGWDSMGHMSVVMELEKEFNVRFPPYALPQLVDVPSIMKMLQGSV